MTFKRRCIWQGMAKQVHAALNRGGMRCNAAVPGELARCRVRRAGALP